MKKNACGRRAMFVIPTGVVKRWRSIASLYGPWLSRCRWFVLLEAVVGVDSEAQDSGHFDSLLVSHSRLKLPAAEGGQNFGSHDRGAGLEDAHVFQISSGIEGTGQHHSGAGSVGGKFDADGAGCAEHASESTAGGRVIGEFHHDRAYRSVEISRVLLAVQQLLVRLECTTRCRGGNHGDI